MQAPPRGSEVVVTPVSLSEPTSPCHNPPCHSTNTCPVQRTMLTRQLDTTLLPRVFTNNQMQLFTICVQSISWSPLEHKWLKSVFLGHPVSTHTACPKMSLCILCYFSYAEELLCVCVFVKLYLCICFCILCYCSCAEKLLADSRDGCAHTLAHTAIPIFNKTIVDNTIP